MMAPTLLTAVVALLAWVVLVFGRVTTSGVTHLLLAIAAVCFVRWWALRA